MQSKLTNHFLITPMIYSKSTQFLFGSVFVNYLKYLKLPLIVNWTENISYISLKNFKWIIWSLHWILTGITTTGRSGPGNNGNENVLHTQSKSLKTGASPPYEVYWHTHNALWRCPWCDGYRRRKWTRGHEFKSSGRLMAFLHSTNTLGKVMNPNILPPAMGK